MLAHRLDGRDEPEQRIRRVCRARREHDVGDRRLAFRDGAGLVEDDGGDVAGALERLAALDQHAERRALASGDHHRRGDGESHRAGARNDQHRDRAGERAHGWRRDAGEITNHEPRHERRDGEGDDDRNEDAADSISEPLNRCARSLRVAHEPYDLREHAVGADGGGGEAKRPRAVDRAADDTVAHVLRDGQRFAGQHGFVDRTVAREDGAVHGNALAGPHQHNVACHHRLDGNVDLRGAAQHSRGLRLEVHERTQRARRLPLRACLERIAGEDECDDDDDGLVVHVGRDAASQEEAGSDGRDHRIEEGRAGTHGDERVHVRRVVAEGGPRAGVEVASRPQHDAEGGDEQRPCDDLRRYGVRPRCNAAQRRVHDAHRPAQERIGHGAVAMRGCRHGAELAHEGHRDQHGEHANDSAHDRLAAEIDELLIVRAVSRRLLLERCLPGCGELSAVAGLADGRDEVIWRDRRGIIGDRRVVHHQVHGGIGHAGLLLERALHARLARGAGHSGHRNANRRGHWGHDATPRRSGRRAACSCRT